MTRFWMTMVFSVSSAAGLGLILYAILTGSGRNCESGDGKRAVRLGFSDSTLQPAGILDIDMGYEGLKHRGKRLFDPNKKHKPESMKA